MDAARREPLRIAAELLEARLDDPHLVGLVVDREVRAVAEPLRLAAQHAAAGGVEGEDPDRARLPTEHPLEPLAHLPRRLVRERDREDLVRLDAVRADQVRDPVGEHARLARAGPGDDEQRPLDVEHGLPLGRIQVGEELLVGCDGHASDASGPPRGADRRRNRQSCFDQLSRTTMPSSSLVRTAPGVNVIPPNSTGTSISPTPFLALRRGIEPSALIPIGSC